MHRARLWLFAVIPMRAPSHELAYHPRADEGLSSPGRTLDGKNSRELRRDP